MNSNAIRATSRASSLRNELMHFPSDSGSLTAIRPICFFLLHRPLSVTEIYVLTEVLSLIANCNYAGHL